MCSVTENVFNESFDRGGRSTLSVRFSVLFLTPLANIRQLAELGVSGNSVVVVVVSHACPYWAWEDAKVVASALNPPF